MPESSDSPKTPDDVKALVEERGIRFIRLWFTDILGQLKSFSINAADLDDAFEGGMGFDGSSITGFNAIEESDMIAMPDASTYSELPWRPADDGGGVARMYADILTPEREPYEGDPRHVLRRAEERMQSLGFDTFNVGPELEYFYFRDPNGTEVLDEGGYFDLTTLDAPAAPRRRPRRPPRDGAGAREAGHRRRVLPPRGRAEPARDRHALSPGAADGRRHHDLPHHGQGIRHEVRLACDLHPKADLRRERLGHAHAPVAVRQRPQRVLRRGRQVLPVGRGQGLHRGPAAPRARHLLDLRPVGELLQAPRARLRVAGLLLLVTAQPVGARARAALSPRQGAGHARGDPLPGPRLQPVPHIRRAARSRARGHRARLRAAGADGEEPLPPGARRPEAARDRAASGDAGRGDRADRGVRARPAHVRRAHLQPLHRDQAPGVGGLPGPGHALGARALSVDPVTPRPLRREGAACTSVTPRAPSPPPGRSPGWTGTRCTGRRRP